MSLIGHSQRVLLTDAHWIVPQPNRIFQPGISGGLLQDRLPHQSHAAQTMKTKNKSKGRMVNKTIIKLKANLIKLTELTRIIKSFGLSPSRRLSKRTLKSASKEDWRFYDEER